MEIENDSGLGLEVGLAIFGLIVAGVVVTLIILWRRQQVQLFDSCNIIIQLIDDWPYCGPSQVQKCSWNLIIPVTNDDWPNLDQ